MSDEIKFIHLKSIIRVKGYTLSKVAEKCGIKSPYLTTICNSQRIPKTDLLAKLCAVLEVYPSEIVSFDGIEVKPFFTNSRRLPLPEHFSGDVTYKPLLLLMADYITEWNTSHEEKITEKDIFDKIEPPRRVKGCKIPDGKALVKAREVKFGKNYKAAEYRRSDYSKGLPAQSRTKLRSDKSVNLSLIYEICKYFGCTVDFVLGYK